ncbi:PREDICTED: peptidyl-prolyl cis-trans isomerase FKBP43 isoform X2 [Tarenaya hassleriana]|uniref:peptidyl-prolyl cis-trans isomerase FKBP43 isoform X2 n=1 Tax=Tarenaya hassleriana TaxID=28532 RepID=UPI00053C2E0E|nr:PREDICTED: peptidyl-prolyl cis-trans isomerase FKBP43 isoform X2 [Tarenaya hassleriana]
MAFWGIGVAGVEVKSGRPFTLRSSNSRLHVSQATLGVGKAREKSIVQCNVGDKTPVFLCALSPDNVESSQLNLEFDEAVEVVFSVIGPRSVHLTGYYLNGKSTFTGDDDGSETYGEDIVDTENERSADENDYDYSDSFINDGDPSGEELTIKERPKKAKNQKNNGKLRRLRKKFQVSDSDTEENWKLGVFSGIRDSSTSSSVGLYVSESEYEIGDLPFSKSALSLRQTRSKTSGMENGQTDSKSKKAVTDFADHTHEVPDQRDKPSDDCKSPSKKKRRKQKQSISFDAKSCTEGDSRKTENPSESVQNEEPTFDKIDALKKKRKKEGHEGSMIKSIATEADNSIDHPRVNKKTSKRCREVQDEENTDKSKSGKEVSDNEYRDGTNKPLGVESLSSGLIIEELGKGNLDGKSAVKGKKVSIIYTAKLKENGEVFDSNDGKGPLRFRLGGDKVIEGLNIGVEGMRAGDKRRLIIPPSLGYTKERPAEDVPENAWLVYEVEAVKVR